MERDENLSPLTVKQLERVTHDLRVHQLELEMQNDTLQKTQQELEKMRDRYMDLYDFAPVGYFTLDEKGVIREANLSCAAMLGVDRDALLSQPFSKFVHGEDRDHFYLCLRKLVATNTRGICELRLVPPQGPAIHVHLETVAVGDEETGGAEIRAVIHDVTERKTAEKTLKETEDRYRQMFEDTHSGVAVYEAMDDGAYFVFKDINPAAERISRIRREAAIGKNLLDLFPEMDKFGLVDALRRVWRTGEPEIMPPRYYRDRDREGWRENRLYKLPFGELVAIYDDVTDRVEAEEARHKARKFESFAVMTGGIAHDYNNLLSMILGNVSLALDETELESRILPFLRDAEEASLRAKDLTHRLMLLSKGSAPQKKARSIKETLEACAAKLPPAPNYRLTLSIAKDLRPVLHDPHQLNYAVGNILSNAMEAMPEGGILTLKAENTVMGEAFKNSVAALGHGKYVKISISDQGAGIPRENISKIFDPYFSTKRMGVQKGMGMGLATAYAVTAKHGGRISVQSTVGAGTTVSIFLPALENGECGMRNAEYEEAPFPIPHFVSTGKSEIKRVLLMDDEEMLRKLVQQMLNRLGYDAQTVGDGAEAVRLYKAQKTAGTPFDAVILDLTIKDGMGGVETLKKLMAIDPNVKAVVSSGYFNDPVMSDFRAYGFCGAMPKPYQIAELKTVLGSILPGKAVKSEK